MNISFTAGCGGRLLALACSVQLPYAYMSVRTCTSTYGLNAFNHNTALPTAERLCSPANAFNEQSKRSGRSCPQVPKPAISPTNQSCCLSPHMQTWVLTSPLVSKQCQRHSVERIYLHVYTSVCHEYECDDGHMSIPPRASSGERDSHLHIIDTSICHVHRRPPTPGLQVLVHT